MPVAQIPDQLLAEAGRQLSICNACRYCEGYCAVFPALERRTRFDPKDLQFLANLCHDCRDCYYACPYIPPHPFGVNPPQLFSELRRISYASSLPGSKQEHGGAARLNLVIATLFTTGVVLCLVGFTEGLGALWQNGKASASPYNVVSYTALVALALATTVGSVAVFTVASARYWRETGGGLRRLLDKGALLLAARYAAELHYMSGGGSGCSYPAQQGRSVRRVLHSGVAYGFVLCLASTIAAAVLEDIMGRQPPYGIVSVPVLLGMLGGIGIVVGCAGLMLLKLRADPAPGDPTATVSDYNLLVALMVLAGTGLATLAVRHSPAFGLLFAVHLAAVITAIGLAPFSKFLHAPFRFLAITQDNIESKSGIE